MSAPFGLYGENPPTQSASARTPPAQRNIGRVRYAVRRRAERDLKYTWHTTTMLAQQDRCGINTLSVLSSIADEAHALRRGSRSASG
jgi:hypothetical protein